MSNLNLGAQPPVPTKSDSNPIVKFQRVWLVAEKISISVSIVLVVCTVGYLSLHALA